MDASAAEGSGVKQEGELHTENSPTVKPDQQSTGISDSKLKTTLCKKHNKSSVKKSNPKKAKKRSKKPLNDSSDSSDSDSSDSNLSSEEEEDVSGSDSTESEDLEAKRKVKQGKAEAKKLKGKQKEGGRHTRKTKSEELCERGDELIAQLQLSLAKLREKGGDGNAEEAMNDSDAIEIEEDPRSAHLRAAYSGRDAPGRRIRHSRDRWDVPFGNLGVRGDRGGPGFLPQTRHTQGLRDIGIRRIDLDPLNGLIPPPPVVQVQPEKAKKVKPASKVAYKRVDQLWDASLHNYKLSETVRDNGDDQWDKYIFTVRRKFDWEHKYQSTSVVLKSTPLKDALQHIMADVKGVSLIQDTPHIDPNMLFLFIDEIRSYIDELKKISESEKTKKARKSAATKSKHLKVLVKYLDKDYSETKKSLYPMLENGMITFDLLWALYKPNSIAYCSTYGDADQPRAFKIDFSAKETNFLKGAWYGVEGKYLEYDGKCFGLGSMSVEVSSFQGTRKINSLDCYPIKYHKDPEGVKATLIERGKKFVALKGMNYRTHEGMAYTKRKRQILKIHVSGRIMVDPAIFRKINPNYAISTVKQKDEQEGLAIPDAEESDGGCACDDSSAEDRGGDQNTPSTSEEAQKERKRYKLIQDDKGRHLVVEVETDENGEEVALKEKLGNLGGKEAFTTEELLIASPVVLGFAFSEKLWLEFSVSGISDMVWNEGAFDSLVLPENQKSIIKALVSSHAFHPSRSIDDIISGKGKGLVAVLHGPPGTGKTLTAEGIADLLRCPLYMVSAGDLGTDPRNLEKELQSILDIAHSWGAILLLDEADVFLEKRSIHDIHRNALVSIFLRLLEYFQGILFLTTNRVETFDEAFVSRIHLSLRYGELSVDARRTVWKMFIDRVRQTEGMEVESLSKSDYSDLAKRNINGRQIKNLTRAAQALAVHEAKPMSMEHIRRVLDVAEAFETELKGGHGYVEAMRGYT